MNLLMHNINWLSLAVFEMLITIEFFKKKTKQKKKKKFNISGIVNECIMSARNSFKTKLKFFLSIKHNQMKLGQTVSICSALS